VRATGEPPRAVAVEPAELASRLAALVRDEAAAVGDGRLGVIVPAGLAGELGRVVAEVSDAVLGDEPDLDARVAVLTVRQAKGLEFDSVLVVDPARIFAESPRGRNDLYVALTRATRRLVVLHPGPLPSVLRGLVA
jgi:superfamily I DNA/RNA helicase